MRDWSLLRWGVFYATCAGVFGPAGIAVLIAIHKASMLMLSNAIQWVP